MKTVVTFLSVLSLSLSSVADPSAAVGVASAVEPLTPDELVAVGLEEVPVNLKAIIKKIEALPASVAAMDPGAVLQIPEFASFQKGFQTYEAHRKTCINDQTRAAKLCREETSPNLQTTLQGVNLVLAGVNSLAVNDACKSFSKAMTLAQAGITAYTVACGAMQKKCDMSCSAAASGMKEMIQALHVSKATCTPGQTGAGCTEGMSQLETLYNKAYTEMKKEISLQSKKTLHSKEQLCKKTYGLLLASSAASLVSIVSSLKQGKSCDEESNGSEGGGGGTAAVVVSEKQNTSSSQSATPFQTATTPASTTEVAASAPTTPVASASPESGNRPSDTVPVDAPNSRRELASATIETAPPQDSELRKYLPGGSKAAASVAKDPHPDITSAGGKTNFEKMRNRFWELGLQGD
ncbi:hypothetical protein AZI85_06475 [Bdellovibrio bacteriovorus]|uniref:Uncharacterized protein n=1 Tax=Bdellovibrio bacteriovorus TaxID=959 RepID=A0A150WFP5_BDEBC|nr:hypothetical protein [Bdellovibrio bacteriovorus]KYG61856.1 hypothetical protein AZI85_06475 [Bdellovibrio bacteriovorus]